MVSRRKILSRSRDDLNLDQTFSPQEEEEDVWYQKEKLYKEHIQEVLDKWTQIDDEIWAKVIVFERNRRVAKAYARAPVLTINGSDDGFDGMRIGLCGFDNPMRDQKTDELKRHIGQGVKIKMDDAGNILVRRYAKSNVYVKSTANNANEETSIGAEILKLPNQALESEKIVKLFDMKKFQSNVNRELRRAYPDRRRLETQCLSVVAFVKSENDILECPIWVLIVNVVAMDMLKSKLPPVQRTMVDIKNRPRIPIPDEDPYSVAGNGSGGSSGSSGFGSGNNGHQQATNGNNGLANGGNIHLNNGTGHVAATREQLLLQTQQLAHKRSEKPPKLPPRDNIYSHDLIPKPDYDDIDVESRIKLSRGKSDKGKDNKKYDDPYYCGLRARVPNFVKSSKSSKDHKDHAALTNGSHMNTLTQKKTSMIHMPMTTPLHPAMHAPPPPHMHPHHIQQQQLMAAAAAHAVHHPSAGHLLHHHQMYPTRSSYESGIGIYNPATKNFLMDRTTDLTVGHVLGQQQGHDRTKTHQQHYQQPPKQQHHRHHSRNCLRRQQRPLPSELYYKPYYYDDFANVPPRAHILDPTRSPLRRRPIGSNCNCVSCYTLAPLFGAIPPSRPSRSLSQQQLRQHQRLSGGLSEAYPPGLVKWCSESDVSELERGFGEDDDFYSGVSHKGRVGSQPDERDFDMDFDMELDLNLNYMRQAKQAEKKRYKSQNDYGLLARHNDDMSLTDAYVDKTRLRQLVSPPPPLPPAVRTPSPGNAKAPALLGTRNKSASIESFFEQPNEEGSLYMYGGRQHIVKAPSTTNLYDRISNSIVAQAHRKFNSQLNLNVNAVNQSKPNNHVMRQPQHKPAIPPPCWRAKRNEFVANGKDYNKNNNIYMNNSQLAAATAVPQQAQPAPQQLNNIIDKKTKPKQTPYDAKRQLQNSNKLSTAATAPTTLPTTPTTANATPPTPNAGADSQTTNATTHQHHHQPPQPQSQPSQPSQRIGRSSSRLDISDMESIYGYLKPRKPRSLSLKKIQILDY